MKIVPKEATRRRPDRVLCVAMPRHRLTDSHSKWYNKLLLELEFYLVSTDKLSDTQTDVPELLY